MSKRTRAIYVALNQTMFIHHHTRDRNAVITNKYQLSMTNPRDMLHHGEYAPNK